MDDDRISLLHEVARYRVGLADLKREGAHVVDERNVIERERSGQVPRLVIVGALPIEFLRIEFVVPVCRVTGVFEVPDVAARE